MNWYEIVVMLLGGGGVGSGILALYNAKSNKTTVDISNLRALIEEERKERQALAKELAEYKVEARGEISSLRHRLTQTTEAIYMAYRCRFPDTMVDCPVIRAYEACTRCERKDPSPTLPSMGGSGER